MDMDSGVYLAAGLAGVSSVAAITATLYRYYRPRFPVKVNCWFCNTDTKVPYGNRNCWDCPKCEQYNGFSEDGDYNKPIPAQYVEEFNYPVTPVQKSDSFQSASDVLCERCQQNQDLKIRQLANFVPYSEATYEYEAEAYKRNLEQTFRLCRWCDQNVYDVIDRQDRKLRRQHGIQSESHNDNSSMNESHNVSRTVIMSSPIHVAAARWLSWLLCVVYVTQITVDLWLHLEHKPEYTLPSIILLLYRTLDSHVQELVLLGLLSALFSVYAAGKQQLQLPDTVVCVLWLFCLFLQFLSAWLHAYNYHLIQLAVSVATIVMVSWSIMSPRHAKPSRLRIKVVKYQPSPESNHVTSTTKSVDNDHVSSFASENEVESSNSEEEYYSDFERMSLGSERTKKRHKPDIFTEYTNKVTVKPVVTSSTSPYLRHSQHSSNSQRQPFRFTPRSQRLVITPARFRPTTLTKQKPFIFDYCQPSTSKGLTSGSVHRVFGRTSWPCSSSQQKSFLFTSSFSDVIASSVSSDGGSMFSEPRDPCAKFNDDDEEENSERTTTHLTADQSSVHPLQSASINERPMHNIQNNKHEPQDVPTSTQVIDTSTEKRIWYHHPVFLFSILFNMILILVFITDKNKLLDVIHHAYMKGSFLYKLLVAVLNK